MISQSTYDQRPPDLGSGPTVLIVDDELGGREKMLRACKSVNGAQSLNVIACNSIPEAIDVLSSTPVHVLLLDKNLGIDKENIDHNGIESIPRFLSMQPHLQILIVTSENSIPDAVLAMRYGAFGYITKLSADDLIIAQVNKAVSVARLEMEKTCSDRGQREFQEVTIAGRSKPLKYLLSRIRAVSQNAFPVLILGESGSGKTTSARMIHTLRSEFLKQSKRPFVEVDCAKFSKSLIERELFGNEAGAYTDAKEAKPGFIEMANNGTLFLDEVAELPLELQNKLLKVLEEGKFTRLGGGPVRQSKFRLICATNRDVENMVVDGTFREDLFMRISTFIIKVPSLKERKEDIPDIVRTILPLVYERGGIHADFDDIPRDFLQHLKEMPIEGGVRGIEHYLVRLLALAEKDKKGRPILKHWKNIPELNHKAKPEKKPAQTLTFSDLLKSSLDIVGPGFPGFAKTVEIFEDKLLLDAESKYKKKLDMAKALKLSPSSVTNKLKKISKVAHDTISQSMIKNKNSEFVQ